jgi:phospholipase/carboxylesterase
MATSEFVHIYKDGALQSAPLLMLHGTGGNETDLMPIAEMIAPERTVIAPRGKVNEGGMLRFFRRFAEGVLDEDDVIARTHELADFLLALRDEKRIPAPVAFGYSNGANIAASLLMLRPEALSAAILVRSMLPIQRKVVPVLENKAKVLMLSGAMDGIAPVAGAQALKATLERQGASVRLEVLPANHGMTALDIDQARAFIA